MEGGEVEDFVEKVVLGMDWSKDSSFLRVALSDFSKIYV